MTLVKDDGFSQDDWSEPFTPLCKIAANDVVSSVDVPSDADPSALRSRLGDINLIRIDFPSFADGRGFTIAAQLRRMGYKGRLRARGHVIADQYAMARRSGFDEVEISEDLARRQPEAQWRDRTDWQFHDYQSVLRG
jgi:uncharacterized protein (DUF934 family)